MYLLLLKRGEIFGYIGPNGAGKTTTMKILVGLITDFQQGLLMLDGELQARVFVDPFAVLKN